MRTETLSLHEKHVLSLLRKVRRVGPSAQQQPLGCDTFVALPPAAPQGTCVFGKNSDRPCGEGQSIRHYPSVQYSENEMLQCTYLEIPQASHTYAVLLSQIDWMWGCEMGANECGVAIGNEAVWTVEPDETSTPALLGMDLVRLGLERGGTAQEALHVITALLETHGQGGACAQNDPSFTYHNSFLIADPLEAYILETAGRHWVAQRITQGTRNISNGLTIRTDFDLHSKDLHEYAIQQRLWNGDGKLDWAATFSEQGHNGIDADASPNSRQGRGCALLRQHGETGTLDASKMMEILKDHVGGLCMHGPGLETTASMVSELRPGSASKHWMTGKPLPCQSPFLSQSIQGME